MQQLDRVHASDLTADGKLRRRFEFDEPEDKKYGVKFAAAFLLGNAVLILKSIFFPSSNKDAEAADRGATEETPLEGPLPDDQASISDAMEEPAKPEKDEFDIAALDLDLISAIGSGSAVSKFNYDETISFTLPAVASTTEPLAIYARSGQIGSNVVSFPTAKQAPPSNAGGSSGALTNDNGARVSSAGTDADLDLNEDEINDNPPPPNRLPVVLGSVTLPTVFINQSVIFGLLTLLERARDADNDELNVVNLTASSGTVTANGDETWTFSPEAYSVDEVTFSYEISDGKGHVVQTATLDIVPIPGEEFLGTDESDVIVGTPGRDEILAGEGDDTILAREDDDFIDAGGGADWIIAGQGDDIIYAGAGDDVVYAGDGDDVVFGGDGDDLILGENGEDTLFGENGNDVLLAGAGDDRVLGGAGDDLIQGEEGNDFLDGGEGADVMLAGLGNDIILAGAGNDTAHGDDGDDIFIATLNDGDDSYDGGNGIDTVSFASTGSGAGAEVDLAAGTATSSETGTDELIDIEHVIGSAGDDIIAGNAEDNDLVGGAGNDAVQGADGDDRFFATIDDGDDSFDGGEGVDTISFADTSAGVDIDLTAGTADGAETGTDQLIDIEHVIGSAGDDTMTGDAQDNELSGGAGNDMFVATINDGDDVFDGASGTDTISFASTVADAVIDLVAGTAESAETGTDQIANIENVVGSQGDDEIVLSNAVNIVSGGGGDDSFVFDHENSSGSGRGLRDVIEDFSVGDLLDFTGFQGNLETDGWQRLTFVYDQAEFSGAGQIRYRYETFDEREFTVVEIRTEFEGDDDFDFDIDIELVGRHELNSENLFT